MNQPLFTRYALGVAVLALVSVAGCASGPPRPDEALARAEASVAQAEQAGARTYSGVEFDQSRDKLNNARRLADAGKHAQAAQLAEQAEVDADLAAARSRHATADKAAKEVAAATQTLRDEIKRQQTTTPAQ